MVGHGSKGIDKLRGQCSSAALIQVKNEAAVVIILPRRDVRRATARWTGKGGIKQGQRPLPGQPLICKTRVLGTCGVCHARSEVCLRCFELSEESVLKDIDLVRVGLDPLVNTSVP